MKSFASFTARLVSVLLAVLFVLTLPAAFLAYDAGQLVFSPSRMTALLEDAVLQSKLVPLGLAWYAQTTAASIPKDAYTPDYATIVSFPSTQDWRDLRQIAITDEMLLEWVDATTNGAYAWLDNEEARPQVTWILQPLQQHLQSGRGEQALQIVYDALPPCSQEQIADFKQRQSAAPSGVEVPYNPCRFPAPWESDQYNDYLTSVEEMVAAIPPVLELVSTLAPDTPESTFLALKGSLRTARTVSRWGWVVPLLLLWLIAALRVRNLPALGLWWGIPLVLGGVATLILFLAVPPVARPWIDVAVATWPRELALEVRLFLDKVVRIIVSPLMWQGALSAGLGLLGILGGVFAGRRKARNASME